MRNRYNQGCVLGLWEEAVAGAHLHQPMPEGDWQVSAVWADGRPRKLTFMYRSVFADCKHEGSPGANPCFSNS